MKDIIWEYDGLPDSYEGDCEDILLEMQRIFYEDLKAEPNRTGTIYPKWALIVQC